MFARISYITLASCLLLLAASGCNGPKQAENVQSMTVQFVWDGNGGSLSSPNPQLNIGNIPTGTVTFKVKMDDLDRKRFNHGGGSVANDGTGVIPVGALKNYKGPQPPRPEVHTYVFTVSALDADDRIIGVGTASRQYPEK